MSAVLQQSSPVPQPKPSRRFSTVGFALCLLIVVWLAVASLLAVSVEQYFPQGFPSWLSFVISDVALYVIAMPLSLLLFSRVPALATRQFNIGGKRFCMMFLVLFPIAFAGNLIGTGLASLISDGAASDYVSDLVLDSSWWVNALFVVVLAPILEEWIFRKQIIDRTRRWGEKVSILLSSLAFGLFHLNIYQFFYAFGVGLVFGYMYMRTSRLRYSILLHMIFNAQGSLLAPLIVSLAGDAATQLNDSSLSDAEQIQVLVDNPGLIASGLYGLAMLALCIAGIVVFVRNVRKLEFYDAPEQLPFGRGLRAALLNPGVIIFIALTATYSVLNLLA